MPYIYINPLAKGLPTKQDPWSGGVWITHWCERTYWCSLLNSFTAVISIMQPLGGCFQCAQSCMCRPVPWVAQRWSYRARIEDGSCRFIDPPTLCPTRSLSPSSRRTVADSAQFYQPLLQKRNHCLVSLEMCESMGLFVPCASCRTRSPGWHVETAARWAYSQIIFSSSLLSRKGCKRTSHILLQSLEPCNREGTMISQSSSGGFSSRFLSTCNHAHPFVLAVWLHVLFGFFLAHGSLSAESVCGCL